MDPAGLVYIMVGSSWVAIVDSCKYEIQTDTSSLQFLATKKTHKNRNLATSHVFSSKSHQTSHCSLDFSMCWGEERWNTVPYLVHSVPISSKFIFFSEFNEHVQRDSGIP